MKRILIGVACCLLAVPLFAHHGTEECESSCLNEYQTCSDQCWDYPCIQECDYWYVQCHYACPKRCDGPTYRDFSVRTLVNAYPVWPDRCFHRFSSGGTVYEDWYYNARVDTYRETTNCDGSKTYALLSSYNEQGFCYKEKWPEQSCSPSSHYYGPTCFF